MIDWLVDSFVGLIICHHLEALGVHDMEMGVQLEHEVGEAAVGGADQMRVVIFFLVYGSSACMTSYKCPSNHSVTCCSRSVWRKILLMNTLWH